MTRSLRSLRSNLYTAARFLGDVNAVKRGPKTTAKRIARKALGRTWGSFLNRLIP